MLSKILLTGLLALGAAALTHSLATPLPFETKALQANGPLDGNWIQDAQGVGSVVADLYDTQPLAPRFRLFAKLLPHDVPGGGVGSIVGKITDAEGPDPHKQPGLLRVIGTWQAAGPDSGVVSALLYLQGNSLVPVVPVGVLAGNYQFANADPLLSNRSNRVGSLGGRYSVNG